MSKNAQNYAYQELANYFIENSKSKLVQIIKSEEENLYYDFPINMNEFIDDFPQYATFFYSQPIEFQKFISTAVLMAQNQLLSDNYDILEEINHLNDEELEINIQNNKLSDSEQTDENELKQKIEKKEPVQPKVKSYIAFKFKQIPFTSSVYKNNISDIDAIDINKLIIVSGTVIRVSKVKTLEKTKKFKCVACQHEYLLTAEHENYGQFQLPPKCTNVVQKAKKDNPFTLLFQQKKMQNNNKNNYKNNHNQQDNDQDLINDNENQNDFQQNKGFQLNQNKQQPKFVQQICGEKKFEPVEGSQHFVDYQEIKIQEPFKTLKPGNIPKTIWIILENNNVDQYKPGDDIIINGVLIKRWKKLTKDTRPDISLCIIANNITIKNHEKSDKSDKNFGTSYEEDIVFFWSQKRDIEADIEARNQIINSICPDIYEKYDIKLAILLCLIGGVTRVENNTRIRGQCHLLIVGEPGTGKSQLLKYATKLSQRSVFTNGIGSSSAGLTVSYIKEGGEFMLEAGALVLADNGICCIDEFNLIKKQDFASILESMEQQTISGLKAGTMSKLNTRTTVLAACNPITPGQKYSPQFDLSENTGLGTHLLSRFDIIFIVTDSCNYDADNENCQFIVEKFMKKEDRGNRQNKEENLWDVDKLREYIRIVKNKFDPIMSAEAQDLIVNYYKHLRLIELHSKTTLRTLESFVRLCQAHARLMYRERVETFDAVCIISLMECSFFTGLLGNISVTEYIVLDQEKYDEIEEIIRGKLLPE